jgi:Zn-dependent peptidase ImmA (M78 family)
VDTISAGNVLLISGCVDPPIDVVKLAYIYGVNVRVVSGAEWQDAIDMGKRRERPTIYINERLTSDDQRFAIARDLGHFFLHRQSQAAFRNYATTPHSPKDRLHAEAEHFAEELLMPAPWVEAYGRYEVPTQLAQRFKVSEALMRRRLSFLTSTNP